MPQAAAPPRRRVVCKRSEVSAGGTASMPVREKGRRSPGSQPARRFSRPQPPADRRQSAGLFAYSLRFTAETDWLLEQDGFEPSVPDEEKPILRDGFVPILSTTSLPRGPEGSNSSPFANRTVSAGNAGALAYLQRRPVHSPAPFGIGR